eukprot:m.76466 g.76466  ORF g.76466 m.76466 type:complete len:54 (+) comp24898_c0_seq2:92-253(+)
MSVFVAEKIVSMYVQVQVLINVWTTSTLRWASNLQIAKETQLRRQKNHFIYFV